MYRQALLQPRSRLLNTFSYHGTTTRPNPHFRILPTPTLRNYASEAAATSSHNVSHDDGDGARNSERRDKTVLRNLIPKAYRRRDPQNDSFRNKESNHPRREASSSFSKPIARRPFYNHRNHKDKSRASFPTRHRRKWTRSPPQRAVPEQRRFMRRVSKWTERDSTFGEMDLDRATKATEKIEEELSRKLNLYKSSWAGLDFGRVAREMEEREEKERQFVPSLFSILDQKKEEEEHGIRDALNTNIPSMADLYATEASYASIATDFRSLILGSCELAEAICNVQRLQKLQRRDGTGLVDGEDGDDEERVDIEDYEDAVVKAEHYLEAFETFYRSRVHAVERSKLKLEEAAAKNMEEGKDSKMLGEVGSFIRDVFTNPFSRPSTHSRDFDESWTHVDGSKSTASDGTEVGEKITPSNFDDLIRSHKMVDFYPDISLYRHVISANQAAYCFGDKAKLQASDRSNRLMTRWISLYCLQKNHDGAARGGNVDLPSSQHPLHLSSPDVAKYPEQRLFHLVMRQNTDLWTKHGSQRVEEWLRRMESLQKAGHVHCGPDVHAYNLLLLSYCNLCKGNSSSAKRRAISGSSSNAQSHGGGKALSTLDSASTKKYILDGVEKILLEINDLDGIGFNVRSLNLGLSAIARAGRNDADVCRKTDRLLCELLGKDYFNRLIDEKDTTNIDSDAVNTSSAMADAAKSSVEPDLDTYHYIVDIYSASGDFFYIRRAMTLLKKMVKLRIARQSNSDEMNGDQMAPSTGTFNNALRALQFKVDELSRLSKSKDDDELELLSEPTRRELHFFSPAEIAKSVTPLIDDMVQFDSSLPTRVTFFFILQLWYRSGCVDAGDQAEKILSRMEVMALYHDIKPFSMAYKLALQCWLASALAGRPGAVIRANRLLEIVEAQTGQHATGILSNDAIDGIDIISGSFDVFDKGYHDYYKLYQIMLKICSTTRDKDDSAHAIDIAFDTYAKMERHGMKLTVKTFELMYSTVQNFIYHHPDHPEDVKRRLLDRVLDAAEKHNVNRGVVIGRWHQSLARGTAEETGDNNPEERDSEEVADELLLDNEHQ